MPHDQIGSAVNAAKAILLGLDMRAINTSVQTHTLKWLLNTLIELGTRPADGKVADSAFRSFLGREVEVTNARKEFDEGVRKEQERASIDAWTKRAPGVPMDPKVEALLRQPDAGGGVQSAERAKGW